MMTSRFAAAALAAGFVVAPAGAEEYAMYQHLDVTSAAAPECGAGVLLSLPSAWRTGDGAVVFLTPEPAPDTRRDQLVAALLAEHAAVLEFVPPPCPAARAGHDTVVAGALDALEAITRTAGAGPVVAIGYGRGGAAVLDVVREPVAGLLGAGGPRYVAAVAIGDGAPAFALGSRLPGQHQTSARLAALCDVLAGWAGGMGATPDRMAPAAAAETCRATMNGEAAIRANVRR